MVSQGIIGGEIESCEKILKVAEELFARRGYDSVAIHEIAEKAGISKSLIFYHFKDKQTLYETIIRRSVDLIFSKLKGVLKLKKSPSEKVKIFIKRYFELVFQEEDLIHILSREFSNLEGPVAKYVIRQVRKVIDALSSVIEEGIREGQFREINPRFGAISLFGMLNAYVTARTVFSKEVSKADVINFDIEELTSINYEIFLKGVKRC